MATTVRAHCLQNKPIQLQPLSAELMRELLNPDTQASAAACTPFDSAADLLNLPGLQWPGKRAQPARAAEPASCEALGSGVGSGSHWGPSQLNPCRLSRSVSAAELYDGKDGKVKGGEAMKTHLSEGRVRGGRPADSRNGSALELCSASSEPVQCSSPFGKSAVTCTIIKEQPSSSSGESKLHAGAALEGRVRGGRPKAAVPKELDASSSAFQCSPASCNENGFSNSSTPIRHSLSHYLSLDSNSLAQLDRTISGQLAMAAGCFIAPGTVEVVNMSPADGGRLLRVRPSGPSLDAMGRSTNSIGSAMSRNGSTLFELAEEQVALLSQLNFSEPGAISERPSSERQSSLSISPSNFNPLALHLASADVGMLGGAHMLSQSQVAQGYSLLSISEPPMSSSAGACPQKGTSTKLGGC